MSDQTLLARALQALLAELIDGPSSAEAYILNPTDAGLLRSLAALSAEAASARPAGRGSIVGHVDHLRYGLSLLNRWGHGEPNPFAEADYAASWKRQEASEDEWRELRSALAAEAHEWMRLAATDREWDAVTLTGAIASIAHLAYHLGAIRQISPEASGPRARD